MNRARLFASTFGLAVAASCCMPAEAGPLLGSTARTFAVLGGGGVSSSGATTVNGNVGSAPTNTIIGFPPGVITGGTKTSTVVAQQAQSDALVAYNFLASLGPPTQTLPGTIGTLTLTPGIYNFTSSALLTGALTLDAQGSDNALFVFQTGSTLTTASNVVVSVINGGPDDGVFWQIGSSATLGDSTLFVGNILADTSITFDPFAQITCGRALAGINKTSGVVTMANANHVAINDGAIDCAGGFGGDGKGGGVVGGVPEPASSALVAAGLASITSRRRRKVLA